MSLSMDISDEIEVARSLLMKRNGVPGARTWGIFGWGCGAGTLEPGNPS